MLLVRGVCPVVDYHQVWKRQGYFTTIKDSSYDNIFYKVIVHVHADIISICFFKSCMNLNETMLLNNNIHLVNAVQLVFLLITEAGRDILSHSCLQHYCAMPPLRKRTFIHFAIFERAPVLPDQSMCSGINYHQKHAKVSHYSCFLSSVAMQTGSFIYSFVLGARFLECRGGSRAHKKWACCPICNTVQNVNHYLKPGRQFKM